MASVTAFLLFWLGIIMGESIYKQRLAASKSRKDIADTLVEWQQSGQDIQNPIFFVAKSIAWLKNDKHPESVRIEAAIQNLTRAMHLLGK